MATGRDEMLKKNQQKSKRKGLMQVLSDYRREEAQKREYKPKNTPSMGKKAAKAKTNTKKAFSGKSLMPSGKKKTDTAVAFGSGSFLKTKPKTKPTKPTNSQPTKPTKPVSRGGTYGKPLPSNPQLKSQAGGSGTYGKPLPSNPKLKTQPRDPESGVSLAKPSAATKVKTHSDGSQTKVVGGKRYTRPNKNAPWKKG